MMDYFIGKYRVDYSEPTQAEIDSHGAECADLFANSDWVSVNQHPSQRYRQLLRKALAMSPFRNKGARKKAASR